MTFETGTDAYSLGVGRYADELAAALVDRAGVRAGDTALDVGCGPGAALAALAEITGPQRVAGVDPSAPFVELARARVPEADVRVGAAEALPFGDAAFDVVVSQLVVNFMADAPAGVREMARASRRTVASCVWDYANEMVMLRAFWDAALELDPDAPDPSRTMRWCSRHELAQLWKDAGLEDVETGEIRASARYDGFGDFWAPFPRGIGPTGAYTVSLTDDRREALREATFRRLGRPDGPFELPARAWFVTGSVRG
ncbi:MAG: methyltransferase domain-containing protein [Actinobacteria bacterium]|nr:methyltransferase domain-containing protein [Actinomycetota bacterium]